MEDQFEVLLALVPASVAQTLIDRARDVELRTGQSFGEGAMVREILVAAYEKWILESVRAQRGLTGPEFLALVRANHAEYAELRGAGHGTD